jgi:hypothetical protein
MRDKNGPEPTEPDFASESLEEIIEVIAEIDDPKELCECVFSALESMLRRESDRLLLNSLSESVGEIIGDLPFDDSPEVLQAAVRTSARACIAILRTAHDSRLPRPAPDDEGRSDEDAAAVEGEEAYYFLPPNLAHLLKRLEYTAPTLPEPITVFETFQQLYEAAILRKIDSVLIFFQKKNGSIVRELPPPFILSPAFANNLKDAIERLIFPFIGNSKQVRILAPGVDWTKIDSQTFWTDRSTHLIRRKILQLWLRAWDDLKLITSAGEDGLNVVQIKENTKLLRALLAPSSPGDYDLPRVTNREILIFESLLETPDDWLESMTDIWRRCQDLYEQEKDPRIFQQKAREGAFRDGILAAFKEFPEQWSDFLVLLCHYVFPRVSTGFLEHFSASLGTSEADRERRMPFLMRYLRQVRMNPAIKTRELGEEEELKKQAQELKNFLTGRAPNKE